ncbi:hypothetical protein D3C78_1083690 [compost metagenome]|jgi:hypothetical protein
MNIIQPWETPIGHSNFAQCLDLAALKDEIGALALMSDQEDGGQRYVNDYDTFPNIVHLLRDIIDHEVKEYIQNMWNYGLGEFRRETNAKWIPPGEGLYPHYHPGSQVSAIFYPEDSPSGLAMFDPRGNACRGYPKQIRNRYMAPHLISPAAGDLWIFPSFVQHSVSYVKEDTRLSMLCEYYFSDER